MANFDDLKMKVTAQSALQELNFALAPVSEFAHNYSELEGRKGEAIVIPDFTSGDADSGDFSASEFNPESNNYFSGTNEIGSNTVTLDKLFVKSLMFTDRDFGDTEVQFFKDGGIALAKKISSLMNAYVFSMFNISNVTNVHELPKDITKNTVANLYRVAAEKDISVGDAVLCLNPLKFSQLLALLDSSTYGGPEAIRRGVVPGLYGFKSVICSNKLKDDVIGAIIGMGTIAVVNRYNAPGIAGAYPMVERTTDENGFTIGFRYGTDLATGYNYLACDALVGAKVLDPKKIVLLKEKAG